ncbi:hypothetical protein CVD28_23820 [Bacillus sp. M6-12]|uniref:hypothetical protein n=1 Tax=Bacillus sp. M6-12 TaxID=2054166 RepID=UPI000C77EFBE|nr:hypothetical protein [Bacillus sp. M6-12]PLS15355.1 hypothetical protein CVD28_23820 [Bacillus sp. M6-12]
MKRSAIFLFPLILCAVLLGCSKDASEGPRDIGKGAAGFLTDIKGNRLLIGETIYSVTEQTRIQTDAGKKMHLEDLKMGIKIKPWHAGRVKESYPMQAEARLLMVLTDETGSREAEIVRKAIKAVQKSENERFIIRNVEHLADQSVYKLEMMSRSVLDTSFMITVEEGTYEVFYQ